MPCRSPMTRVVCVVGAAVKNRFRRKARPPNRGGFEVRHMPPLPMEQGLPASRIGQMPLSLWLWRLLIRVIARFRVGVRIRLSAGARSGNFR